jgi:hypothetical protein
MPAEKSYKKGLPRKYGGFRLANLCFRSNVGTILDTLSGGFSLCPFVFCA